MHGVCVYVCIHTCVCMCLHIPVCTWRPERRPFTGPGARLLSSEPQHVPLHASRCWAHRCAHGHTRLFTGAPGTWPPGLMLVQYMSLLQSHLLGPEEVNFSDKVMQSLFSDVKYCSFVLCMSFSKGFLSMFRFQPQRSGPTF